MGADGNSITRAEFDELRRRLEAAEARLNRGDTTLALMDQKLETISAKLVEMATDLKALKEKPAKRWDAIVSQVISWAVAILLGYIAIRIS